MNYTQDLTNEAALLLIYIQMTSPEVSEHMAKIGKKGGESFKPGSDQMRKVALAGWTPRLKAKRLRNKKHAIHPKHQKINNNIPIA